MPYLNQLYSELKLSKKEIYKEFSCQLNALNFIKHLENKALPEDIFDNLYIIYFHNDGNGFSLYGKKGFSFHVNFLFFDKESSNWYMLDYEIENIIEGYRLDKPVLCSEFLQYAFCTKPAEWQLSMAIQKSNYFPLKSFQQVMIFSLQEYKKLHEVNINFIDELRFISIASDNEEENFLWKLYKDFNISFNNLYEFFSFLKKKDPSINLLRTCYQNKSFKEIFIKGFANAECRLDKEKLLFLKNFLFDSLKSINLGLEEPKVEAGGSTFFTPLSQRQIPGSTEKNTTPRHAF